MLVRTEQRVPSLRGLFSAFTRVTDRLALLTVTSHQKQENRTSSRGSPTCKQARYLTAPHQDLLASHVYSDPALARTIQQRPSRRHTQRSSSLAAIHDPIFTLDNGTLQTAPLARIPYSFTHPDILSDGREATRRRS